MRVVKFGGSSIGTPERMLKVREIVESFDDEVLIVVSALEDVTDDLERITLLAAQGNIDYEKQFAKLRNRHLKFIEDLTELADPNSLLKSVEADLDQLEKILEGVYLLEDITPKTHDRILSYGELISARILGKLIRKGRFLDSRKLILTDERFGGATVLFPETNQRIQQSVVPGSGQIHVAPGFIAATASGAITTLGRGGSDYSAAIYTAATGAEQLEIWTDVDGFMTADPRKVPKAFAIGKLSYAEAMELSHFGAGVLYTPTIQPVYQKNIPVIIRNTFRPGFTGTVISHESDQAAEDMIKGVSSIDDVELLTVLGPGMVGVKGISSRIFGTMARRGINIILITQASSEYSISFAISPTDSRAAAEALNEEFSIELSRKAIGIQRESDLSIIAIVGERMKNTPGISATLFGTLGRNGISVIATAQGSSELNISVVVRRDALKKALNVIHEGFFLSHLKELHLYLVGVGTVGGSLLHQMSKQQQTLLEKHQLKINVVGITRSKKMLLNPDGIDLKTWKDDLENGEKADIDGFIERIKRYNLRNSVFVDCTAEDDLADKYMRVLNAFASIVTANKVACSSDYNLYRTLKSTALKRNVKFMFETNVGAGLPVISTINDLIRSGDRIYKLEAVLSGTLNFIFNELSESIPMSRAIEMAREAGFSEPDPRIDLSGIDVIRKLLILARESGYEMERDDVTADTFLPASCFEGSLDDFWEQVRNYDSDFENRRQALVAANKRWRFVATLEEGKGRVGLQEVGPEHPAFELEGSNNIILITTERYCEQPMVIKGYGAGAAVTAAGVFADIMRIANV